MPRNSAAWFIHLATLGKCSLIWMPGAVVAMGLKSPASLVPGFKSNVSLWLGPPSIHRRMQDLCLPGVAAARPASTCSQPDSDTADTPAADSFNHSRRERSPVNIFSPRLRRDRGSPVRTADL